MVVADMARSENAFTPPSDSNPANTQVIVLAFEGPDSYAHRGRLAESVLGLCGALMNRGFGTTLIFPGDPACPAEEVVEKTGLKLVRWGQWVSRYYPNGPYEGLETRVRDFSDGVSLYVGDLLTRTNPGQRVVIIGHEWQTAGALQRLHRDLLYRGQRDRAVLIWTMRHALNLAHVDVRALSDAAVLTTVSRFLKHEMWKSGVDPLVLPVGLPDHYFIRPASALVEQWRTLGVGHTLLWKPGPWRVDATGERVLRALLDLKNRGRRPLLILEEDMPVAAAEYAASLGLYCHGEAVLSQTSALDRPTTSVDIVALDRQIDDSERAALARAAVATLALGEDDPTGVAVLEEMARGAVVITDNAMCDALIPAINSLPLETDEATELVAAVEELVVHADRSDVVRRNARRTAEAYAWDRVVDNLLAKLEFIVIRR